MEFWRFASVPGHAVQHAGTYHPFLVSLSVAVACLGALAALAVVRRMLRAASPTAWRLWLAAGSAAMGSGIWAMHFTGMLAFDMHMPVSYDVWLTALSVLPAILGSGCALVVMSRQTVNHWRVQLGGLYLALGIGTMHYTGMEAMVMPGGEMRYDPLLFLASIVVAHALATAALYVRFIFGTGTGTRGRLLGAVVMGTSVASMHYIAMAAARFHATGNMHTFDLQPSPLPLAVAILLVVSLILGLTLIGTLVDRRLSEASAIADASARRERAVLEAMVDGVIVADPEGRIAIFNASAEKLFGLTGAEARLFPLSNILSLPEGDVLQHYRSTGNAYVGDQVTGIRADRTHFPADVTVSELPLPEGALYVCTVRDISERHEIEQQLSQSQKLESIGQLAAGIAHEINTPVQYVGDNINFLKDSFKDLTPVLSCVETIIQGDSATPEQVSALAAAARNAEIDYLLEEVPRAIDQAREGVDRVAHIVRAMKEFSHPSTDMTQVNLNRAIESTVTVAKNEWKYVADLSMDLDPDLPLVPCLQQDFNQVILNMVVNAAHAISDVVGDGGTTKGKIAICTRQVDDSAEITISDSGSGIPDEVKERIFDPFFTTKEVGKGTGQGLSIAHSVIHRKHGGSIQVNSKRGEGTTFCIRLPLHQEIQEGPE